MLSLLIMMRCNQEPNLIQRTGSLSNGRLNFAMTHSENDATQLLLSILNQISATEMRMLQHIYNINLEDHVTNDNIKKEAKIEAIAIGMRRRPLQWYGHVRRRDREKDIIMVAEMKIQRKRIRRGPKKKLLNRVKDGILKCGLSGKDVDGRIR